MANEIRQTFKAAADLSDYQYCFCTMSDDNTVTYCGTNGKAIGVIQNKDADAAGTSVLVVTSGRSLLKVNEAAAINKLLTSTSAGAGEIVDAAGEFFGAIVLEAADAQNDVIEVNVMQGVAHASDA